MKLLTTIVQNQDANRLMSRLSEEGFGFTKVSSTGGFLREGNTTLLIGVEDDKMDSVLSIIKETCRSRERSIEISTAPMGEGQFFPLTKVTVGGAMIFIQDVESLESF